MAMLHYDLNRYNKQSFMDDQTAIFAASLINKKVVIHENFVIRNNSYAAGIRFVQNGIRIEAICYYGCRCGFEK